MLIPKNTQLPENNLKESSSYTIGDKVDSILSMNFDEYKNNENVVLCKRELSSLLNKNNGSELKTGAVEIITNLLTNRPEFSKLKLEKNDDNFLFDLKKDIESQSKWYKSCIEKLESEVNNIENLETASNPGWFSIKQKSESQENSMNYKLYTTIPVKEYNFLIYLIDLAKKLEELGLKTNDKISLKVPYNLLGFLTHNDSLVIHFKNLDNRLLIEKIMNDWLKEYSISEESRNLGRLKFALDSKDTSFSNMIANNIANWISENYGKYDNNLLVDLAIKYAIEAGQKVPNINGKKI